MTIHLLRRHPPEINGRRVSFDKFERMVQMWREQHRVYGTWTARKPKRGRDDGLHFDHGSSVYFVIDKEIRFRMPLVRIERVADLILDSPVAERYANHWSITCRPEIIEVEPRPVGWFRGWRYLEDPPPDATGPAIESLFGRQLSEMGIVE